MKTLQRTLVLGLMSLGLLTQACGGAVEGSEKSTTTTTTGTGSTGTTASTGAPGTTISPPAEVAVIRSEVDQVITARLTASTSIPQNPAPAVDVTISDPAVVDAIFNETLALTPVPSGQPINCPAEFGVSYHLEFDGACNAQGCTAPIIFEADVTPDGCEFMSSPELSNLLSTSATYWQDLASDFGLAESTIYPYQLPSD